MSSYGAIIDTYELGTHRPVDKVTVVSTEHEDHREAVLSVETEGSATVYTTLDPDACLELAKALIEAAEYVKGLDE